MVKKITHWFPCNIAFITFFIPYKSVKDIVIERSLAGVHQCFSKSHMQIPLAWLKEKWKSFFMELCSWLPVSHCQKHQEDYQGGIWYKMFLNFKNYLQSIFSIVWMGISRWYEVSDIFYVHYLNPLFAILNGLTHRFTMSVFLSSVSNICLWKVAFLKCLLPD